MARYPDLSDKERRRLYEGLTRAAKEIRITPPPASPAAPEGAAAGAAGARLEERAAAAAPSPLEAAFHLRLSWRTRVRIDRYAYLNGFLLCGFRQLAASFFSFLRPKRDFISPRLLHVLMQDDPLRPDPSGYGLLRALKAIREHAGLLLRGEAFLQRSTDRSWSLRRELQADLKTWEPFGFRMLELFSRLGPEAYEIMESLRPAYDRQRPVHVAELVSLTRFLYHLVARVEPPLETVRERVRGAASLIKAQYHRFFSDEQKLAQVTARIDRAAEEFLACFQRLRWFARQLYPVLLRCLNRFEPEELVSRLAADVFRFLGLEAREVLKAEPLPVRAPSPPGPAIREPLASGQAAPATEAVEAAEREKKKEFQGGILAILAHAFPGSRIERVLEGDASALFWFHHRLAEGGGRRPGLPRRIDVEELIGKLSYQDPLSPVILIHELLAEMLAALDPESLDRPPFPESGPARSQAASGPAGAKQPLKERFRDLRERWDLLRVSLFRRYLQEVDLFERERSLSPEAGKRFRESPLGRKTLETVNQIRNHVIRGYGNVALPMDRSEVFRCPSLFSQVLDLQGFLDELVPDRSQLRDGNPVSLRGVSRPDLIRIGSSPVLRQIADYIEALPRSRQLIEDPRADFQRSFLEILGATLELLGFLIGSPNSPLRDKGGEVFAAGAEDRRIRAEMERDRTPLRVVLARDVQERDELTGLLSKNEYLRLATEVFEEARSKGWDLTYLLCDLDHFKAVNDALGHDLGDEFLRASAGVILACMREEDLAVRFGGEEMLVVLKGDYRAGFLQGERIRTRCQQTLTERFGRELKEIPVRMAEKERGEEEKRGGEPAEELEERIQRWRATPLGTLSAGTAQGLGKAVGQPCRKEKELFVRADRMLYLAKDSGRNRVVGFTEDLRLPLSFTEYQEYLEFRQREGEGAEKGGFPEVRQRSERPLQFTSFRWEESPPPS